MQEPRATMPAEPGATRRLIEFARRGFQAVGVDVRRHRPEALPPSSKDIFAALLALRQRAEAGPVADDELSFLGFCAREAFRSRAQLMQDLFALYHSGGMRGGFFVEVGATDGVTINNTVLLERDYGWTGILAEPARFWHERLRANRSCTVATECVWRRTGESLLFNETPEREYSTIERLSSGDAHAWLRTGGSCYAVETVSLLDLLERSGAPRTIDYLSVDTEGSELDILGAFDFTRYDIRLITVEHNYTASRARLHALLTKNGFARKFEALSHWDDWYVHE